MSKTLGWDGYCSLDAEIDNVAQNLNVPFYKIENNKYLLEVACNRAGAYLTQYLFYFVNDENLTAKLLSFERFEKKDTNEDIQRYISYYPTGQTYFDEETKLLHIRYLFASAGQCGWEIEYKIENSKAILNKMRAEWNCNPGMNFENWRNLNLKALRKRAGNAK